MKYQLFAVSLLAATMGSAAAVAASEPTGIWRMDSGKVTIEVAACGNSYCGKIVGLDKPLNKRGKPKRDKENPDKALRKRPVIGLTIISDMKRTGDDSWKGTIYNADDGKTYDSKMKLESENVMIVKGCVLVFCKDMKFERVVSQ